MTTTIAISGKGGSGKTTLTAMIIRSLIGRCGGAVLAVDADPNSCLGLTLGVQPTETIADIREKSRQMQTDKGSDKMRTFEYGIETAVTEASGFDLLTMGRPEGPSCYCAANNLLRKFLDKLSNAYNFVVMDNEAGMEHLSRRTTNNVDLLFIVAEGSPVGEITARRIFELTKQLPISVKQIGTIWNKCDGIKELDGIPSFGWVPYDKSVFDASMQGKTIFDLEGTSPAFSAVQKILEQKLNIKQTQLQVGPLKNQHYYMG